MLKIIITIFIMFSWLSSADTTIKIKDRVGIELDNGSKVTKLPYGYYDPALYHSSVQAFREKDLSAYGDKRVFVGYGLYDKGENNCKFIDMNPIGENNWNSFNIDFENNITKSGKTYAISRNPMGYVGCKSLVNKYHGTIYAPQNIVENNSISNDEYYDDAAWIGYTRADCSSEYKNEYGKHQDYENFLNPYSPCSISKLGVVKLPNSTKWDKVSTGYSAKCIIEIDSPKLKAPKKICAPWWKIQRNFRVKDSLAINGVKYQLDYLAYSQFDVPLKKNLCTLVNTEYKDKIKKENPPRAVTCRTYFDRGKSDQCEFDMHQASCFVDKCKMEVKDTCELMGSSKPYDRSGNPSEYRWLYDENGNPTKKIRVKDNIVIFEYRCPPNDPPVGDQCLFIENVLVYPKECTSANNVGGALRPSINGKPAGQESDCVGLKDCILNLPKGAADSEVETCQSNYYCEKTYPRITHYDPTTGQLIKLSVPCNNGYVVEIDKQSLGTTERTCTKYAQITETNTTLKSCEVDLAETVEVVDLAITDTDTYQDDPKCIRTNDIYDARPKVKTVFNYKNNGFFKTIIKKAYLDGTKVDNATNDSEAYLMAASSSKMQECKVDPGDIVAGQTDDDDITAPLNEQCLLFEGNAKTWMIKRLAPFYPDDSDAQNPPNPNIVNNTEYVDGLQSWIPSSTPSAQGLEYTLAVANSNRCIESSKLQLGQTFKKSLDYDINESSCSVGQNSIYNMDGTPERGKVYNITSCNIKKQDECDEHKDKYTGSTPHYSYTSTCGDSGSAIYGSVKPSYCSSYSAKMYDSYVPRVYFEDGTVAINSPYEFHKDCTGWDSPPRDKTYSIVDDVCDPGQPEIKDDNGKVIQNYIPPESPHSEISSITYTPNFVSVCTKGREEPLPKTEKFRPQGYRTNQITQTPKNGIDQMGTYNHALFTNPGCYMMSERIQGDDRIKYIQKSNEGIKMELSATVTELECTQTADCFDMDASYSGGKCIITAPPPDTIYPPEPLPDPNIEVTVKTIPSFSGSFVVEIDGTKDIYSIQEYADAIRGFGYFSNFHAPVIENNVVDIGGAQIFPGDTLGTVTKNMPYSIDSMHFTQRCKNKSPNDKPKFNLNALCLNIVDGLDPKSYLFDGLLNQLADLAASNLGSTFLIASILYGGYIAAIVAYDFAAAGMASQMSFLNFFSSMQTLMGPVMFYAFVIAIVVVLVLMFSKSKKYGNFTHNWNIKEPMPSDFVTNRYDSRFLDTSNHLIWYDKFEYTTGLLKKKDYQERSASYLEAKKARLKAHGYSDASISMALNSLETGMIGFPGGRSFWHLRWCKSNSEAKNIAKGIPKQLNVAYLDAVNSVSIVVPYAGDYEVSAFDAGDNMLARKTVLQKDFIPIKLGAAYGAPVQFGTSPISTAEGDGKFTIASSITNRNLSSGACLSSTVVEWGGGVSGAYYEVRSPEGFHCDKSNDAFVQKHSATKIKVRATNSSRAFVVELQKPLPFANRVYLVHLGAKETRKYSCFDDQNCTITPPTP